ncbi:MAG: phosphatidate cytidylyltransferase, partial [Synergistes sp.]|nr:phosphatidate cytidylyltransferase [Synergistes sp.]
MGKLRDFIGSSPDLGLRTFSSIFIVAAIIGGIYFGGLVWSVVVSVIALLSLWEFRKLQSAYLDSSPILVMLAGLFILGGTAYGLITPMIVICTVSAVAFISLFIEVLKHQGTGESDALVTIGADVAGIAYIVMP